jgi:hypothetical protein
MRMPKTEKPRAFPDRNCPEASASWWDGVARGVGDAVFSESTIAWLATSGTMVEEALLDMTVVYSGGICLTRSTVGDCRVWVRTRWHRDVQRCTADHLQLNFGQIKRKRS